MRTQMILIPRRQSSRIPGTFCRCEAEEEALMRDQLLHPRKTHNCGGEPVFHLSVAKQLLCDDASNNWHKQKSQAQLQSSWDEYKLFKPKKFKERIYQEVKRQKFINYLEMKRTLKEKDCCSQIGWAPVVIDVGHCRCFSFSIEWS